VAVSETALSKSIQAALRGLGFRVLRLPAGHYRGAGGSRVQVGEAGMPDLLVLGVGWLEVKTPTGRLSAEQRAWHQEAADLGEFVAVVRSVQDAVATVRAWAAERRAR
jgi:hypothetical protein